MKEQRFIILWTAVKNKEVSESAKKYEGPITVEKNTILRAAARKDGVEYGTGSWYYLIGAQSQDNWETPKAPSDVRIDSKSSSSANISWAAEEPGCTYRVYANGKMVWEGLYGEEEAEEVVRLGAAGLLMQGIATSIDALSVGFTIADYGFVMAFVCSLIVAATTFCISYSGLIIGKKFGTRFADRATVFGGVILVFIGLEIFITGIF